MDAQQGGAPGARAHEDAEERREDEHAVDARLRNASGEGLARAAGAAHQASAWARERGGVAGRVAAPAQRAEEGLVRASSYVRHRDAAGMRADLEREVDRNPLRALAVAAGVGFVLGRLLR